MRALIRRSLLLVSILAGSAAAQPPSQSDSRDIIVEGSRDQERRIAEFVDSLTKAPPFGQLSRFEDRICPLAVGIAAEHREAVVERLRQVATAVGIPVAGKNCNANLLVLLTHDKPGLMRLLERKKPYYFPGTWSTSRTGAFVRDPSPVAVWHLEGKMGRDGRDLMNEFKSGVAFQKTTTPGSLIYPSARPHFLGAIMVIDMDALTGLTTTQLADYAAMRSFARTDPRALANSTTPTILHIIDTPVGEEVPVTMTEWDFSFLKALYGSDARNYAGSQRSEMRKLVKQELSQVPDARE